MASLTLFIRPDMMDESRYEFKMIFGITLRICRGCSEMFLVVEGCGLKWEDEGWRGTCSSEGRRL